MGSAWMDDTGGGKGQRWFVPQSGTVCRVADEYTLQGLEAGLAALRFVLARDSSSVTDVARELGIARSRAHRILRTLERSEMIAPASGGRGFVAGRRMMDLATPFGLDLTTRFSHRPVIDRVFDATGESVHTSVLIGNQLLVTNGRKSAHDLDIGLRVGMMMPAHAMAGGKLLLSMLDDGQVLALLPPNLEKVGPRTTTERVQLLNEIQEIRALGYAMCEQESERGVDSVATLLSGETWRDRTAIVISVPSDRGGRRRLTELAGNLVGLLNR